MEQNVREKAELQRELDLVTEEKENLKGLLEEQRQEAFRLKVGRTLSPSPRQDLGINSDGLLLQEEFQGKDKENVKLMKEIGDMKEQNDKLQSTVVQQQKESEHFKVCVCRGSFSFRRCSVRATGHKSRVWSEEQVLLAISHSSQ